MGRAEISRRAQWAAGIALAMAVIAQGLTQIASAAQPANEYPSRPIKIVVPFAAGGGADIIARHVAKLLDKDLGQPVVVENRPGANGMLGTEFGARAEPDGYTLLIGSIGTLTTNQFLFSRLPYDPAKDFEAVTLLTKTPNVIVVAADSPITSLQQLVQSAKATPGALNTGVPAIGDTAHLGMELFRRQAGIDVVTVPYNGVPAATTDLLGGRTQFMFASLSSQLSAIRSGKLRALAVTDTSRSPLLPDVPTVAESGYPGFAAVGWLGLMAPAGTPPDRIHRVAAAVQTAYLSPDVIQVLKATGDPAASTPKQLADLIMADRAKWSKVIDDAKIRIE